MTKLIIYILLGVEKNRWDACKSMIQVEKRLNELEDSGFCRQKRKYEKIDKEYWDCTKKADQDHHYKRTSCVASNECKCRCKCRFRSYHTMYLAATPRHENGRHQKDL